MRAEALSWDDWSADKAPPVVEEDKWHVALAPGEVKIVSLEQLDDLFRLSIVDAETKVWQEGMSEWQPLRVIAGLDEAPVTEAKRTHPKAPSPRSAPPPPRPQSVAPSLSVRPAPYPPRTQPLAPAPIFAESFGLAAGQSAFSAPLAVQPVASVRPLIVSTRPAEIQRGGGFGRFLVGLSLVAGVGVSLYRNGVIRDAAQAMHQDALFARLESTLGGPAFGTPRAVEQGSAARAAVPLTRDSNASLAVDSPVKEPTAALATPKPSPSDAEPVTANAAPPPNVVSLESRKPLAVPAKLALSAANSAPVPSPKPAAQPKFEATQQPKAARAKPATVGKRAPAAKPATQMTEHERLNTAIGQSVLNPPGKSKSKSDASEYDPLNPKL